MKQQADLAKKDKFRLKDMVIVSALIVTAFLIAGNTITVLINANQGYQVLSAEQKGLNELANELDRLEKELAYYRSYDYTELYARDELNLVRPGQKLYSIEGGDQFYEVVSRQRQIVRKEDYLFWWQVIFAPGLV